MFQFLQFDLIEAFAGLSELAAYIIFSQSEAEKVKRQFEFIVEKINKKSLDFLPKVRQQRP